MIIMPTKYKSGEKEAIELLTKIGLRFVDDYSDSNSKSMPDLKLDNDTFIEVTHTKHTSLHNDCYYTSPSNEKYFKEKRKQADEKIEVQSYNKSELLSIRKRIWKLSIH